MSSKVYRFTRAGSLERQPQALAQKAAQAFSNLADGSTLVVKRDETGIRHYLMSPDTGTADNSALLLAQAAAASSSRVDEPVRLNDTKYVVEMTAQKGTFAGQNTQVGSDPLVVANSLSTVLGVGDWIAVGVRRPRNNEKTRNQEWLRGRGVTTHHSMNTNAVLMSMVAGSDSEQAAHNIVRSVASGLPGFDMSVGTRRISAFDSAKKWFLGTGIGIAVGALGLFLTGSPDISAQLTSPDSGITADQLALLTPVGFITAAVAAVGGTLTALGKLPSRYTRLTRGLENGELPSPAVRGAAPKKPQNERNVTNKDGTQRHIPRTYGDYPLAANAFLVGPQMPVSVIAPHGGAESGSGAARERPAPPELRRHVGINIGLNEGAPVHLDAKMGWAGILAFGAAGSGKSQLVQSIWAWNAFDKMMPSDVPGGGGRQNAMIALETKGDGAYAYEAWSKEAGDQPLLIELGDPSTWGLDILVGSGGTYQERARDIVAMMKYAFSDGSIMESSFDTLSIVFAASLVVDRDIWDRVPGLKPEASSFYYASVLLGQRGEEMGVSLAAEIRNQAVLRGYEPGHEWREAADGLLPLYGDGVSPSTRKQLLQPPRNKVSALLAAEQWWARPNKVSWDMVLQNHGTVIVNTGSPREGQLVDDELSKQVTAMLMHSLYMAIRRNCSGWQAQGRNVSIFSDELSMLAGNSPEVITFLREQGRSYGVRQVYATQYPEQLDQKVRESVMNFATLIAFQQQNPNVIRGLIDNLSMDGSVWETADLAQLPRFSAVVRTQENGISLSAFTVAVANWWEHRGEFAAEQGFTGTVSYSAPAPSAAPEAPVYVVPEYETPAAPEYRTDIQPGFRLPGA